MKTPRTLILLAAAHELKLLRQGGAGQPVEEIRHLTLDDLPAVDFAFRDRATREGGSRLAGALHVIDPRQSDKEKERGRMVSHVIEALGQEWATGGYDRIVISAPDKMLGLIRAAMPKELAPHVAADLDKDLVKIPLVELANHLGAAMRF